MGILPVDDEKQQLRIRHFLIASGSYVIWLLFAWLLELSGSSNSILSVKWLKLLTLTVVLAQLTIFVVLRSGINKRFRDPSLTFVQVLLAVIFASIFMYFGRELRGTMLLAYVIILSFGAYRLTQQQLWLMVFISISVYALIIFYDAVRSAAGFDLEFNIILWLILLVMLSWVAILGGYLAGLRKKVKQSMIDLLERNKEIKEQRDKIGAQKAEIEKANADLQIALERLGELASKDDLTGLFNRRQFMHTITNFAYKEIPDLSGFAICLVDIDKFKLINDTYGHQAGDHVLKQFSEVVKKCLRSNDVVARYGGEEFVMLLPSADKASAVDCGERLRQQFSQLTYPEISSELKVTLSVGITHYQMGERVEETLSRVDEALYKAKGEGRDRVTYLANSKLT